MLGYNKTTPANNPVTIKESKHISNGHSIIKGSFTMRSLILFLIVLIESVAFSSAYKDAISIDGDNIRITESAKVDISEVSINQILFQAGSEPVFIGGEQIGYRLFDIDAGSVFETAGFMNGDIVTHIDGTSLSTPKAAMDALISIKFQDEFYYTVMQFSGFGKSKTFKVVVTGK